MKRTFTLFLAIMFTYTASTAQTLGPFTLYDYLTSATHPTSCTDAHVTYWPQDSIWVNFSDGQVISTTFNLTWVDQAGDDLLLETGFHEANYDVRLRLQGGGFSAMHSVVTTDWTYNMDVDWKYLFSSCGNGSVTSRQEYYLPLDFAADFGLGPTDVVIGLEITFRATSGAPDFAGAYIIQPPVLLQQDILEFTAQSPDDQSVELNWDLNVEYDNDYYEVQRSTDAVNWQTIKVVPSKGNSPQAVHYQLTDEQPLRGYSYYKIKMVDQAETVQYSPIRSVYLTDDHSTIAIIPNPATHQVKVTNIQPPFSYQVHNSLGQVVQHAQQMSTTDIDISQLAAGSYYITIEKDDTHKVLKLVKE